MAKQVSAEEKRQKVLSLFHEDKDFYTLKELEKILSKRKGINPQLVKDILATLVGDDLIRTEKIGITNFFWSFPSQALVSKENILNKLKDENEKLIAGKEMFTKKIDEEMKTRMSAERFLLIDEYEKMKMRLAKIDEKIELFKDCDPEKLKEINNDIENAKTGINATVDKIFELQGYVVNNFGMERNEFLRSFNIEEDLDYA